MNGKPVTTRRSDGEFSTVVLPDGTIETCWFPDDGPSRVVGRTPALSVAKVAALHVENAEAAK